MLTLMINVKNYIAYRRILNYVAAVLLLIASSRIVFNVPITATGIPITAQSLAVILVIFFLKKPGNWICILIYLLLGALGLGVFAEGAAGVNQFLGKSGGYLYGFLFSAVLMNSFHDDLKRSSTGRLSFLMLSTIYILLFGMLHLSYFIGLRSAFEYGIIPFLTGAIIKVLLAFSLIEIVLFLIPKISLRKP